MYMYAHSMYAPCSQGQVKGKYTYNIVNVNILCHYTKFRNGTFTHNDSCIIIVFYKSVMKPYKLLVLSN